MTTTMTFGARLYTADSSGVWDDAQALANANGAPVAVWGRDGWLTICDVPPDDIEPNPEDNGWTIAGLVDPGTDNL